MEEKLIGSTVLKFTLFVGLVHVGLFPFGCSYLRIWQHVLIYIYWMKYLDSDPFI